MTTSGVCHPAAQFLSERLSHVGIFRRFDATAGLLPPLEAGR